MASLGTSPVFFRSVTEQCKEGCGDNVLDERFETWCTKSVCIHTSGNTTRHRQKAVKTLPSYVQILLWRWC